MITGRDRDGDGVLADSEASGDPLALCPPTLETGVTRADPTPACPFGVEISMAPDESGQSADRESAAVSVCGASSSIAAVEAGRDLCPLGGTRFSIGTASDRDAPGDELGGHVCDGPVGFEFGSLVRRFPLTDSLNSDPEGRRVLAERGSSRAVIVSGVDPGRTLQVDYIDRAIQDGREQRCVVRIVVNDEECGGRDTPLVVDLDRTVAGGDGSKLVAFGGDCVPGTYRVTRSSVVLVVELTADPGEFCGLLGGSDAALVVSQRLSEE